MRLATYRPTVEEGSRLGAIVGDMVVDLEQFGAAMGVTIPNRMLEFIDLGPSAISVVSDLLAGCGAAFPLG